MVRFGPSSRFVRSNRQTLCARVLCSLRVGVGTPTSRPTCEAILLKSGLLTALLLANASVVGAQPTTAGVQLRQIPPPSGVPKATPEFKLAPPVAPRDTGPAGTPIRIRSLALTGVTVFDASTLLAASSFAPDSTLDLAGLRAIAARVATYYHHHGYFLAQAYLPVQEIADGAVTIAVIEGRYGKIDLDNRTRVANAVPRGVLNGLDSGDIVATTPLERRLLLLSDLPNIKVGSTLAPGAEPGTSDLVVGLTPGRRVTGSVEADNGGNRYTGTYRLGGTVDFNEPLGIGDRLSLRVLASSGGLAYGRAAYQAPVGNLTLGVAYAHIRYELGREFDSLEADGIADVATVYGRYPLIRSRNANLYALAAVEAKWFEDRVGLVSSRSKKTSRVGTLGLSGDAHDSFGGGGWTDFSVGGSVGDLDIRNPAERAADALTTRRDGGFGKLDFSLARAQTISGPLSLYGAVRGQVAFDNLDASEQIELGGAYGVRAYPEGDAYGDEGYIATIEARLTLGQWLGAFPGTLQAIGFVDVGEVRFAHDPWFAGTNHAHRSGIGAGLAWAGPRNILLKASYAHKLGDAVALSEPDRAGRFWFQIVNLF